MICCTKHRDVGKKTKQSSRIYSLSVQPGANFEVTILKKELQPVVGAYNVTYADTDQNNHMNNTRYPDMYSNFLPLSGKRIERITISYMNEAPAGDLLTVQRAEAMGAYYFRTLRSDGKINSEAEIRLTDV